MSSLWLNWRFGGIFLQVNRPGDWGRIGWGRVSHLPGRPKQGEAWVSIYEGRWQFALLLLAIVLAILWVAS